MSRPSLPPPLSTTRIDKPWGHELLWAKTDRYVGKLLFVRAGEALSLQYHERKDETILLLSGRLELVTYREGEAPVTRELPVRTPVHLPAGTRHRMVALEDSELAEVSTPELDDVVRLEDRYGRAPSR